MSERATPGEGYEIDPRSGLPLIIGAQCRECRRIQLAATTFCAACRSRNSFEPVPLSRRGRLYSVTRVWQPFPGVAAPYAIGYVDFPEGVRLVARVELPPAGALTLDVEVEPHVGVIATNADGSAIEHVVFRPVSS